MGYVEVWQPLSNPSEDEGLSAGHFPKFMHCPLLHQLHPDAEHIVELNIVAQFAEVVDFVKKRIKF